MTNDDKSGGPAFPIYPRFDDGSFQQLPDTLGMTLRDYFAAAAMQGWLSSWTPEMPWKAESPTNVALSAYQIADAMIVQREK